MIFWHKIVIFSHEIPQKCMHLPFINKNVDIKFSEQRRISGITFITYAQNQKIGNPNNLTFWEQYTTKGLKHDSQNLLRHQCLKEKNLSFIDNYII